MYWAEALSKQNKDEDLKKIFTPIAKNLKENEAIINQELIGVQGHSVTIGGYYEPTEKLVFEAMRPSKTFNSILSKIN
jgi:isocitrate dehydrogenase